MVNFQQTIADLQQQRDAIDQAIAALLPLAGGSVSSAPARPAVQVAKPVKRAKETTRVGSVHERNHSILTTLERAGGVARSETLRKSFAADPAMSDMQQSAAFRNALQRLKAQGKIGRTGDTWSLV